jgi:hypothetical protein
MNPKVGQRWFWKYDFIEEIAEIIPHEFEFKLKTLISLTKNSKIGAIYSVRKDRFLPQTDIFEKLKYLPGQDKIQ